MKLKFKEIMSFTDSYQEIQNEKMPLNIAYQLSQIAKEVNECINFYQEKYNHYLEQYAEKEEDGTFKMNEEKNGIVLKTATITEAHQKFRELDNYEFPIETRKIPLSAFNELKLSPSALQGLIPFIEDEKETKK